MMLADVTIIFIWAWPALILASIIGLLGMSDRGLGGHIEKFVVGATYAALLWVIPVLMVLSIPLKGKIEEVELLTALSATYSKAMPYLREEGVASWIGAYVVVGGLWALIHFWLYARRLGLRYVRERDAWMQGQKLQSLDKLGPESRESFQKCVIVNVQNAMYYCGDFPLKAKQQKRFFAANLLCWPATLSYYLLSDLVVDVAARLWRVFRSRIHHTWTVGMAEYLADDALCTTMLAAARK